ncbi:MAG: FtsX-like permease family protein [Oscillospiraceae bacterium]
MEGSRRQALLLKTSLASALRPRATRLVPRARSATNTPTGYPTTHLIFRGSGLCCLSMCWSSCCPYRCLRSAYQNHLRRFSADVGALRACGVGRRQICIIFAVELAAVFLLAALCAVPLSIISLKPLFTAFLEIRHDSLDWLIFHVEPLNILLHLLVFFVALALSLGISLHSYSRKSARVPLNDTESEKLETRSKAPSAALLSGGNALRTVAQPHKPQLPLMSPGVRSGNGCVSAAL